jgi:hypothetical protein
MLQCQIHTLPDHGEVIGIEALVATKRIPLPSLADLLIVLMAIKAKVGSTGYFAPIGESPGTPRVVLATLDDIKKAVSPSRTSSLLPPAVVPRNSANSR